MSQGLSSAQGVDKMAYEEWYRMITDIIDARVAGGRRKRKDRTNVMGKIDANYTVGRPMVILDDDPSATPIGPFPYLSSYSPTGGDRVLLTRAGNKYVVVDKIL